MCLETAKSIPTGELLAIARRKEDGGPIQKSHVWNTNRVDDSPEIWERR
jgi:hypothetical protein|nr:MAG TPA: hypothetical protein [Caudoviricetes sp.]